jgi:transposase
MAVLQAVERFGTPHNSWLIGMLERKPRMRVAIALANKMARGLWAMVTKQEDYRPPRGNEGTSAMRRISCPET